MKVLQTDLLLDEVVVFRGKICLLYTSIDAYTYVEKAPDDLTPRTKENLTLEELMKTWMAKMEDNCLFISARERINIDELKDVVYQRVKELHVQKLSLIHIFIFDMF